MKFFEKVTTIEELKKEYRVLAKKHHPDRGGDTELMKQINNEYERLFARLPKSDKEKYAKVDDGFRQIIDMLINIEELELEINGTWLWISGETWNHAELLGKNGLGCKFSKPKKSWYWYDGVENQKKQRGRMTREQIRELHGSEVIKKATPKTKKQPKQIA